MPSCFSVLMSLYEGENPRHFEAALQSIAEQTLRPTQIVLVFDGPLTPELEKVVARNSDDRYKIVRLEENRGLGEALNEGLQHCHHEIVVRADTDDINLPDRFRIQVSFMDENPDISALSADMDEFSGDPEKVVSCRNLPTGHDDIVRMMRARNPLNHPASVFRKSAVLALGGYPPLRLAQDYGLWIKLCAAGHHFANINQSLVLFRKNDEFMKRRGSSKYIYYDFKLQHLLYSNNLISAPRFIFNFAGRSAVRLAPNSLRRLAYSFLRS